MDPVAALHVSNFGMGTTEKEILNVFSAHVKVRNVVMKGPYCFVNCENSEEAAKGKAFADSQHLAVNGSPLVVQHNHEKPFSNRDRARTFERVLNATYDHPPSHRVTPPRAGRVVKHHIPHEPTCNLHVTGYPDGTTETALRELFSPYCHVQEIAMKTHYCFVNVDLVEGAVSAKKALNGAFFDWQPIQVIIGAHQRS